MTFLSGRKNRVMVLEYPLEALGFDLFPITESQTSSDSDEEVQKIEEDPDQQ